MNELVSVIIPVYRVERYLNQCLKSVVNQTYQNLEIVLIDDGSPDHCPQMCDEWAERDKRIRVIHQKNGGVASARNCGLDVSQGQYVVFCDSDDLIHPQMVEHLLNVMQQSQTEIACCQMQKFLDDEAHLGSIQEVTAVSILQKNEAYDEITTGKNYGGYIWNKIFSRSVLEQGEPTRFKENLAILEDQLFLVELLQKTNRIACIEEKLYCYRQQNESVLHQKFSEKTITATIARERILQQLQKAGCPRQICSNAWNLLMKSYCITAKKIICSSISQKHKWMKYIMNGFRDQEGKYKLNRGWSVKDRGYLAILWLLSRLAIRRT